MLRSAPWTLMPPAAAYRLAALRFRVYVLEQEITQEEDLDGRDLEPGTLLYWAEDPSTPETPVATLRVLHEPAGHLAIGRVATDAEHRGRGLAGRLLRAALADHPDQDVELHAQAHLENWYARFGFRRIGPDYLEAGIPHAPMLLRRKGSTDS